MQQSPLLLDDIIPQIVAHISDVQTWAAIMQTCKQWNVLAEEQLDQLVNVLQILLCKYPDVKWDMYTLNKHSMININIDKQ